MMSAQFPDEQSESGEFERQEDAFREWISLMDRHRIPRKRIATIFMFRSRVLGPVAHSSSAN